MTRPSLHQQPGGLPRRGGPATPVAAPALPNGWVGDGHDWSLAWSPAPGQPRPEAVHAWRPAPTPNRPASAAGVDVDPPTTELPDSPLVELARSVHLRRAALDRMMRMNLLHARNAWEQRRHDPIAAHVLAWLFAQPDGRPIYAGASRLCAAWRLWVDGEDARDLPDRLFRYLHALVKELPPSGADPRTLATSRDEQMREDAVYVGLGISSLDTPTGTWQQLLDSGILHTLPTPAAVRAKIPASVPVGSDTDVPGTVRILLSDATVIVAERRGMAEYDQQVIAATTTLDWPGYDGGYPWTGVSRWALDASENHGPVLERMAPLHDLFTQLDQARLIAGTPVPGGAQRPRGIA